MNVTAPYRTSPVARGRAFRRDVIMVNIARNPNRPAASKERGNVDTKMSKVAKSPPKWKRQLKSHMGQVTRMAKKEKRDG